jgi:hypothetical protein
MQLPPMAFNPGIPALVWLASYVALVVEFKTWRLGRTKVHETGKYTLRETVFYYNHFLRELPIDTLLAGAVAWSYAASGASMALVVPARLAAFYVPVMAVFLVWVFAGSIRSVGWKSTLQDLFQHRERDDLVSWGSHWQMHFLSTLALLLIFVWPGTFHKLSTSMLVWLAVLLSCFILISLVFRTGIKAVLHPRWVLHGAREIFTYTLIAGAPLLLPLLTQTAASFSRVQPLSIAALAGFVLIGLHSVRVFRTTRLDAEAQSDRGVLYLLSSHFFEHVLDYLYIVLLLGIIDGLS